MKHQEEVFLKKKEEDFAAQLFMRFGNVNAHKYGRGDILKVQVKGSRGRENEHSLTASAHHS